MPAPQYTALTCLHPDHRGPSRQASYRVELSPASTPPSPSLLIVPVCEACWRRHRYHDPLDTYREDLRARQRAWYHRHHRGKRGATKVRVTQVLEATSAPQSPAAAPAVATAVDVVPRRRSSAEILLARRR
jgi:hypothetical protein